MDPFHKFCVLIIYTICRRADALLSSGSVPIELQHEWSHNVESLVVKSAKQLADKVVEAKTNGLYLCVFPVNQFSLMHAPKCCLLVVHSTVCSIRLPIRARISQ